MVKTALGVMCWVVGILVLAGPMTAQDTAAESAPISGSVSFAGIGSGHQNVIGELSFKSISIENDLISGHLKFEGQSVNLDIAGGLGFTGNARPPNPVAITLAFVGASAPKSEIFGRLKFLGPTTQESIMAGSLGFIGQRPNTFIGGALNFVGMIPVRQQISGELGFSGCLPEETVISINERPPNFLDPLYDPHIGVEGNYIINWTNADRPTALATLTKGGGMDVVIAHDGYQLFEFVREPDALWGLELWFPPPHTISTSSRHANSVNITPSGLVEIDHYYDILGPWGGNSTLSVTDGGLWGQWNYYDKEGKSVWTKVQSSVEAVSRGNESPLDMLPVGEAITLSTPYIGPVYSMRGNRESVVLRLHGKNLWGRHYFWIARNSGLEIGRVAPICPVVEGDGSDERFEECWWSPGRVTGLDIALNVWSEARSSSQTLVFDDIEIPINLIVENSPPREKMCTN